MTRSRLYPRRHAALLALCASLLPLAALARDISGELTYPARIALPPDAEVALDLRGPSGSVALLRQATEGRQVPLPFTLATEAEDGLTLHAAIFSGGRAIWVADPVPVAAGAGDVALGPLTLAPHLAIGDTASFLCGGQTVDTRARGEGITLSAGGRDFDLAPTPAASGARYADGASPETSFWSRGNRALLRLAGTLLPECLPMIPPALLPFTARGNEPFWSVRVARDGLSLALPEGKGTTEDYPYADPATEENALVFSTDGFTLRLEAGPCRDSMTGMPYPYRATLTRGDAPAPGCAGDPAMLLQGDWQVTDLRGTPVADGIDITLGFAEGRLAGKAACNRVTGTFTLTGEGLSIGPLASTRMACPPPQMEAERATLDALAAVTAFDIDAERQLLLLGPDGTPLLVARR